MTCDILSDAARRFSIMASSAKPLHQFGDEDEGDEEGDDLCHHDVIDLWEDAEAQGAVVCYHISYALASHSLHEEAEEDAAYRHGKLSDEEIEEVEDAHAEEREAAPFAEREGAGGAGKAGEDTEQNGGAAARHTELLADEGCRDLEHRDAGCQGCHDKEEIEHQRDAVAQQRR